MAIKNTEIRKIQPTHPGEMLREDFMPIIILPFLQTKPSQVFNHFAHNYFGIEP